MSHQIRVLQLDGCRHIFLDVGSNIGQQVQLLYEKDLASDSDGRKNTKLEQMVDQFFGPMAERRQTVCAIGIEANPRHKHTLRMLEQSHRARGWRTHFLTETAASARDGVASFYADEVAPNKFHEWGASLVSYAGNTRRSMRRNTYNVSTIDLTELIRSRVFTRRIGPKAAEEGASSSSFSSSAWASHRRPAVVMKMDIESAEFAVLPRLLSLGVLCKLDAALIEYHAEQNPAWSPLMRAYGAPRNFKANVEYLVKNAGGGCNVALGSLAAHEGGS